MIKNYFVAVFLLISSVLSAQTEGFNYKFLLMDNNNQPLANQNVDIRFTLNAGSNTIWQEEHTGIQTDANGIAVAYLGEGNRLGGTVADFDDIDWSVPVTMTVEIDTGSGYQTFVSGEPVKYVPKAKFALHADYNGLVNKPEVFYKSGGTDVATAVQDSMYHLGRTAFGIMNVPANVQLYVYNNDDNINNAIENRVISTSNDIRRGIYNHVSMDGSGYTSGIANSLDGTGNGTQVATWNKISNSGSGTHLGVYNSLSGTGTGFQVGEYTQITTVNDNYQYGTYAQIDNDGNGWHIGYVSYLLGAGAGPQYGVYNWIIHNGDGDHFGTKNELGGSGNGSQYGAYNFIWNTGSGNKYGSFNYIPDTLDGTHYAVFGRALKAGSYAGYFDGDLKTTQKLLGEDSGDADMKAYIYGLINSDGSKVADACSGGFQVQKIQPGVYRIQFTNPPASNNAYLVVANLDNNLGFIKITRGTSVFVIRTYDTDATTAMDAKFSFVVYKK